MGVEDLSVGQLQQLKAALGNASPQLNQALNALDNVDKNAAGVIVDVAKGKTPSFVAIGSIIAAGVAATGVGAPVAAIIAAGLPLASLVISVFGLGGDEHCDWKVGSTCFKGHRPYGPGDKNWTTLDDFASIPPPPRTIGPQLPSMIVGTFPHFRKIQADYERVAPVALVGGLIGGGAPVASAPSARDVFLRAYGAAWRNNAERAINGHPSISDAKLLDQVVNAWRRARPTRGPLDFTIDGSGDSFVDALVRGDVDGNNIEPIRLSGGPIFDPRIAGMASAVRGNALDVLEINQKPAPVGGGAPSGGASPVGIAGIGLHEIAAVGVGAAIVLVLLKGGLGGVAKLFR